MAIGFRAIKHIAARVMLSKTMQQCRKQNRILHTAEQSTRGRGGGEEGIGVLLALATRCLAAGSVRDAARWLHVAPRLARAARCACAPCSARRACAQATRLHATRPHGLHATLPHGLHNARPAASRAAPRTARCAWPPHRLRENAPPPLEKLEARGQIGWGSGPGNHFGSLPSYMGLAISGQEIGNHCMNIQLLAIPFPCVPS